MRPSGFSVPNSGDSFSCVSTRTSAKRSARARSLLTLVSSALTELTKHTSPRRASTELLNRAALFTSAGLSRSLSSALATAFSRGSPRAVFICEMIIAIYSVFSSV